MVADEPTSRLDPITQQRTIAALVRLVDGDDRALVLVTHDPSLADAVTDRTLLVTSDRLSA